MHACSVGRGNITDRESQPMTWTATLTAILALVSLPVLAQTTGNQPGGGTGTTPNATNRSLQNQGTTGQRNRSTNCRPGSTAKGCQQATLPSDRERDRMQQYEQGQRPRGRPAPTDNTPGP